MASLWGGNLPRGISDGGGLQESDPWGRTDRNVHIGEEASAKSLTRKHRLSAGMVPDLASREGRRAGALASRHRGARIWVEGTPADGGGPLRGTPSPSRGVGRVPAAPCIQQRFEKLPLRRAFPRRRGSSPRGSPGLRSMSRLPIPSAGLTTCRTTPRRPHPTFPGPAHGDPSLAWSGFGSRVTSTGIRAKSTKDIA